MVFVGDERRYIGGHTRVRRQAEQVTHAERSRLRGFFQRYAGVDYGDPLASNAALNQDVGHRLRDGDDTISPSPEARMPEREIDSASHHQRGAAKPGTEARESQRVCVVGMENRGAAAELRQDCRYDSGIDPGSPAYRTNRNPGGLEPLRQHCARPGDDDLFDSESAQLPGE